MTEDLVGRELAVRLLERAAEIDAGQSEVVSVEQLRQAATDAGISSAAFEEAARELSLEGSHARSHRPPNMPTVLSAFRLAVAVAAMGTVGTLLGLVVLFGSKVIADATIFVLGSVVATIAIVIGLLAYWIWGLERVDE